MPFRCCLRMASTGVVINAWPPASVLSWLNFGTATLRPQMHEIVPPASLAPATTVRPHSQGNETFSSFVTMFVGGEGTRANVVAVLRNGASDRRLEIGVRF